MNLLGIVGLLGQAGEVTENELGTSGDLFGLLIHANFVVQLTLLLLLVFSVLSWAIIWSKHRQLKKCKDRSNSFYQIFWGTKTIEAIVGKGSFRKSPAFTVFKAGIDAIRENRESGAIEFVEKDIRRAVDDEIHAMESRVSFLATTGSSAPFIGLFGTVWGILNAFWKIGRTGASSLAIVGPHIAEALIATAIGLAAAIPAVMFYNFYVSRIRHISKDLNNFADDLVNRIRREYFHAA